MSTLVILESPTKAHTVKGFLGKGYKVIASNGHVRDLPKSKLGIDVENGFEPQYINIRGKGDLIKELKKEAKNADKVLLAADPDREGEAISWHLAAVLGIPEDKIKRITFNSVTKAAVKEAIKSPRNIDMDLVNSQQTRRILDRLVGYKISPFLWKKIKNGLSAGRVQSVATRLIVEREREIQAFVPDEYWTVTAKLANSAGDTFTAKYFGTSAGKQELHNESDAMAVVNGAKNSPFTVASVKRSVKHRRPQPPFTTSTLQQEANRRLSLPTQRTMMIAQELYEGINIGEHGTHGLITYMRTDSLRVSDEARAAAKEYIVGRYGDKYYPATPNIYKAKKGAQDAHEAIRPSDPTLSPDMIKNRLTTDQYRLYKLIYDRFIASQMKPAEIDTVSVDLDAKGNIFRATGATVRFPGYLVICDDSDSGDDDLAKDKLPSLNENDVCVCSAILPEQHFTAPPFRYTEGSLVKMLEEKGIGRPSTIVTTITTIISRGYVVREGKSLVPTDLGFVTTDLMMNAFSRIVDYNFTAEMEENLDEIESGDKDYIAVLESFYKDLTEELSAAESTIGANRITLEPEKTDMICEKCGSVMVIRSGRYGKFAACPNYPKCRNTKPLETEQKPIDAKEIVSDEKCPTCGGEMVLRKGRYGSFFACRSYPNCKTTLPVIKDSGVVCPNCGKRIVIRTSKKKTTYYVCEDSACGFISWDIPQTRRCPQCGDIVLKKKNKDQYYCRGNCGWTEESKK